MEVSPADWPPVPTERPSNMQSHLNSTSTQNMRPPGSVRYFAYGSNLNPQQMLTRCPGAQPDRAATLAGWRFQITDRGVATVISDADHEVQGGLWWVTPEHLDALDIAEGVALGLYRRQSMVVFSAGEPVEAVLYIERSTQSGRARNGYMQTVREGAAFFQLDPSYGQMLSDGGLR